MTRPSVAAWAILSASGFADRAVACCRALGGAGEFSAEHVNAFQDILVLAHMGFSLLLVCKLCSPWCAGKDCAEGAALQRGATGRVRPSVDYLV